MYIIAAFFWWGYLLVKSNNEIFEHKNEIIVHKIEKAKIAILTNAIQNSKADSLTPNLSTLKFENQTLQIDASLLIKYINLNFPELDVIISNKYLEIGVKHQIIKSIANEKSRRFYMFIGEGFVIALFLFWAFKNLLKAINEKNRLLAMQSNFMLSVTHELKTPVASSKLMLETIQKRKLDESKVHYLIEKSLEDLSRLDDLIEKILISAKLENQAFVYIKEAVNFSELLHKLKNRYGNKLGMRTLIWEIENDLHIYADSVLISSMVFNLIENAIKYSPPSTSIHIVLSEEKDNSVIFSVSDQGDGISELEKQLIFAKFYRSGNENTRTSKGTGLGLFIVSTVVKEHKAKIFVSDNKPNGTIFKVRFPKFKL